jgi:hypothetical protein
MPGLRPQDLILGMIVANTEGREVRLARIKNDASADTIEAITDFYNANFSEKHTVRGRTKRYRDADAEPLNIALVSDDAIVGLLESRLMTMEALGNERVRLLATLLIDPAYRNLGLSRLIFDEFLGSVEGRLSVVVRYRDSNRENLARLYRRFGFSQPEDDGKYARSKEKRWRMIREAST